MSVFCGNCGAQLEAGDAFCVSCGARQSPAVGSQARPAPEAVASPHRGTPLSTIRAPVPTPLSEPSGRIAAPSTPQAAVPRQPLTGAVPAPSTRKRIYAGLAIAIVAIAGAAGAAFYAYRSHQTALDANIVGSIKAKFFDDASLRKCTIDVTAHDGVVTLVGQVNTDADKENAIGIAKQQQGVKQVVSQLTLPGERPPDTAPGGPTIVRAIIQDGATSIQLPSGRMYIYGMATGGAAASGPFATGQYAEAVDAAGQLAAALAYGSNDQNSYTTQTGYHVIGGISVEGTWTSFHEFYGSNQQAAASGASANFTLSQNSLVVVIGLAASQQSVQLAGIPALQIDASSSGPGASEGMVIAHAYLGPGTYTATEQSAALAGGQDPDHMADLIGIFVFGSRP